MVATPHAREHPAAQLVTQQLPTQPHLSQQHLMTQQVQHASAHVAATHAAQQQHISGGPLKMPSIAPPGSPWHTTMERLVREVDARADIEPTRAALLLAAHARIYIDGMSDPQRATQALRHASELAANARFVSATWRWLSEQGSDPAMLLQQTRAELRHVGDGRDRTALLWQIAAIEEHVIFDIPSATKTMRELLALEPNDVGAWDALSALYLRLKSPQLRAHAQAKDEVVYGGVCEALDVMAQATDDPTTRGALHGAVGALRARYLGDDDGAIASLRRAIDADNTNAGAQSTLETILLRRRAWDEYAKIIAAQAERTRDQATARECYERAGDVYAECIGDHGRAAHCFVRAATLAEGDPGPVEKLAIVLEAAARWEDAAAAYERLLGRLGDPTQKAWTLVRLGNLQETRLERADDALAAYRLAVDAAPAFAPAVEGLLRVARDHGLHALAIELEQREADRTPDPNARAIRYVALAERVENISAIEANEKNIEEASAFYERALLLDPLNPGAFDALDRIYRTSRKWPRLIALYEATLASTPDRRRAQALRLDLAELQHVRSMQPTRAADLLREALAGPEDRFHTLVALARALADAGRWPEYVEALEAQASMLSGDEEIAAIYRIGTALESRVKDTQRALATYEVVLDRAPNHEAAARGIIRIHEREGRWEHVVRAERRLLELATRTEDLLDGLFRIAQISEERLGHIDEAIAAYSEALQQSPSHLPALAALERLLRVTGNYLRLAQVLMLFAEATSDPHVQVRVMIRAATVLELCLDDSDTAVAAYSRALAIANNFPAATHGGSDPDRVAALWGLLRLQETRTEWANVDATLDALVETTNDSSARLRILVRQARNAELRLNDIPRAALLYEEAVMNALDAREKAAALAVDRVRVARLDGNNETIAVCLRALAKVTTDERLQSGLYRVLALTAEHEPGAHEIAAALYERLVARDPEDPQALDGLIRSVALANDARLAPAIMARARATLDVPLRALLAFAAGMINEVAGRTNEADVAYTFSLLAEPELLPVLDAARRLRMQAGNWKAAASLAERSAGASLAPENAAQAWLDAGEIYETHLDDSPRALASYRALLSSQPAQTEALERALRLLEESGDFGTSASLLAAHVEAVSDPKVRAHFLRQRAAILAGRLGDTPGAIIDLRRAMALIPHEEDVATMEVLAVLEERTRHWQEALQLYERVARTQRNVTETVRRRARLAQARIMGDELRDDVKAKAILEALLSELPADRETALKLAEVSARSGDDKRALSIYNELTTTGPAVDRARALLALAELKRTRPDKWKQTEAEAAVARAYDLAIADSTVIAMLEERAAQDNDYRSFTTNADAAVSRVPPNTPGVLAMRTNLARVLRDKMKNHDAADRHLASAIQAFPESMPTRLALAAGLRGRNDEAALGELRRAVEVDPTSPGPYEALASLTASTLRPETSVMLRTAAVLLGATEEEDEPTLTNASPLRPIPEALLFEEAMGRLVGPTRSWFLRRVLEILEPFLPKIFPGAEVMLETRARLPDSYPIVSDIRAIAAAVGAAPPMVCRGAGREVALLLTEPRALVLGNDLLTETGRPLAMFHAAYACSRLAANGSLYTVPRDQVVALLDAAAIPDTDGTSIREFRRRLSNALPRKSRKDLERIILEGGGDVRTELSIWEAEEARRSLYSAVVLCRDLRAVGSVLAADALAKPNADERRRGLSANTRLREVLEFVASPACWDVFKRVYGRA